MNINQAMNLQEMNSRDALTDMGSCRIDEVQLAVCDVMDYPEMDKVAVGNWNDISTYEDGESRKVDTSPSEFGDELSEGGWELLWCDVWDFCEGCGNLIRTSPTSYGWKPQFYRFIDYLMCRDCILGEEEIFDYYIEDLKDNPKNAMTFGQSKLEDRGWTCSSEFINGLHEHQDDSPEAISEFLEEIGIPHVFSIDYTGQFDVSFSVYFPPGYDILSSKEWGEANKKCDISPAEACRRALSSEDIKHCSDGDGAVLNTVNPDGTVDSKEVSKEDFIEGNM